MGNLNRKNQKKFANLNVSFFTKKEIRHAFVYLILSALGGIAECSVFYILSKIGFGIITSNIMGFGFGLVISFTLNVKKNFGNQDFIKDRFTIYVIISLIGLFISTGLICLFTKIFGFSTIVSKFLQLMIMAIPLYMANRFITFGNIIKWPYYKQKYNN